MALGNEIQLLREERGLSQKELANLVGVTTGNVAEWEADESAPSLAELSRLSKALNVSSDVLLDATTEVAATPTVQVNKEPTAATITPKNHKKTGWIIGALIAATLVVVAILLLSGFWGDRTFLNEETTAPTEPLAFSENTSAIEVADASVVKIFCYDYEGELAATGSGFVAFDGQTIITNYHVMSSAYTCKISTNQDISYEVSKILCYSKDQDIAILQLAKDTGLQPLTLGDSSIIKKGETVVAIGSPLGIKNTVSTGNLSGRVMEDNMDVLQFTAPISSGSSGGALFDNNGNVIGITFASYVDGQNLNLAIPIELAIKLYDNKSTAKKVSAIHIKEYPHVAFLEKNPSVLEVTLTDLKNAPQKFDGQIVKLTTYVSSVMEVDWLFLSDRNNVSGDYLYDWNLHTFDLNFEDHHILSCHVWCENYDEQKIAVIGNQVTIIGKFVYYAKGEEYLWEEGLVRDHSSARIYAEYIY